MVPCHFAYSEWKFDKQPATPVKSKMEPLSSGTDRNSGRSLTNSFSFSCSKVLCHIIRYSRHHGIIDQYRYLICLGCCRISGYCCGSKRIDHCLHGQLADTHDRHLKSHGKSCLQMQNHCFSQTVKIFSTQMQNLEFFQSHQQTE